MVSKQHVICDLKENRIIVDSVWYLTICAEDMITVKFSCISSVDGINL